MEYGHFWHTSNGALLQSDVGSTFNLHSNWVANTSQIVGIPTQYGPHEPWKIVAQAHGRTKPFRPPRGASPELSEGQQQPKKRYSMQKTVNDGRPPDTEKALLKSRQKIRSKGAHSTDASKGKLNLY